MPLKAIGYALPAGHRLRLAVSTSYWPWIWPSPEPVELTVTCDDGSPLELPVRAPAVGGRGHRSVRGAGDLRAAARRLARPAHPALEITRDVVSGWTPSSCRARSPGPDATPTGVETRDRDPVRYTIARSDPLSATVE